MPPSVSLCPVSHSEISSAAASIDPAGADEVGQSISSDTFTEEGRGGGGGVGHCLTPGPLG